MATGDNEPLGVTVLRALGLKRESRRDRPDTEEVLQAVQKLHRSETLLPRRVIANS